MARFTRVFGMPELRVRFARGLRFRLTLSYVLFFMLLLTGIGLFYRQILEKQLERREQAALEEQWDAAKGYLSFENERPVWSEDPEDAEIVAQLQQMYLIADANGIALKYNSDTYDTIRFSPAEIQAILGQSKPDFSERSDKDGNAYLIEAGTVYNELEHPRRKQPYFLAIGQVGHPGKYDLHGNITVAAAVAMAGGFTSNAKHSQVLLFRRVNSHWSSVTKINLKHELKSRSLREDPQVEPGDMVYIPKNTISKIKAFVPTPTMGTYATAPLP